MCCKKIEVVCAVLSFPPVVWAWILNLIPGHSTWPKCIFITFEPVKKPAELTTRYHINCHNKANLALGFIRRNIKHCN